MMPSHAGSGTIGAIVLAVVLAGCQSGPGAIGGLRRGEVAKAPPKPAPGLNIPDPPSTARGMQDEYVKPASFIRDPNPQMIDPPLRVLYQRAAQCYAGMDAYIFNLRSREVVNGKKQPETLVRVRARREPFSVHLTWLNEPDKGREVIYVHGRYDNKMQILLGPNDLGSRLFPRQKFAPDDPMVRDKTRYAINENGFGQLIARFGELVAGVEKNDPRAGATKYLGRVNRPEFREQVECVHQTIPAGSDRLFPRGGQRWWFFNPTSGLPVLIISHDPTGEVEYYCCEGIQWPAPLDERDFDPDRLWRK